VIVDPLFASIENRDFIPDESSPVYKLGFKKIPENVTKPKRN
jgi:hypothetical protein